MAVKIRLARHGAKKNPYYRIVVADARCKRDGRNIEEVGRYNPMVEPSFVSIDLEKVDEWVAKGAIPTDRVAKLIEILRTDAEAPASTKVTKAQRKAAEAAAAAEAEAAAAAEAAEEEAASEDAEETE